MSEPRVEYQNRLAARRLTAAALDRWDRGLSWVRGLVAVAAVAVGWLIWRRQVLPPATLLGVLGVFLVAVIAHDRVATRRARVGRAIQLYERALARLDDKWHDLAEDGSRFLDPQHPYAADLDLFGPRSLFQLLCTARTTGGESTLARWLAEPAPSSEIMARQQAVEELRRRLDLREALWIAGHDVRAAVDAERLAIWGAGPPLLPWRWMRPLLFLLSVTMAVVTVAWVGGALPVAPAAFTAVVVLVVTQLLNARASAVADAVSRPETHLTLLAELARVFEREFAAGAPPIVGARLRRLHEQLMVDGTPASRQVARLGWLARTLAWQHNLIFTPIAYALLWRTQFAFAIEAWRRRSGPQIAVWIQALSDLEALGALATMAYDHPRRPFPRLADSSDGSSVYTAVALRHPLLPGCVPNDVHLGSGRGAPLIILSGSNMSGKSTLMRTVGVNAVLAMAGGTVRANDLELSPLALGATLRIQDSLMAGTSRFYAEVTRLRQLVDLARGPTPLLFLIDEILAGTNSHDRRLGATSVLRGLVNLGAIGIASTHDLALTDVAAELPGKVLNHHFQDDLKDGVLTFDYKLRPGVVQRSNALALMRAVGLDV